MIGAIGDVDGQTVLQLSANPVLNVTAAQLADIGLPVIGVVSVGQTPPANAEYARWISVDRRQAAARPIIDGLLARTAIILGDGFNEMLPFDSPVIRAIAKPAIPLVSGIRAGLNMPGMGDLVTTSPAINVIAGQTLALRILGELRIPADQRSIDPLMVDAEAIASEQLQHAGGHQVAVPPAGRFATMDEPIIINAGDDDAFYALTNMLNRQDLRQDFRYKTMAARIHNGVALHAMLEGELLEDKAATWLERFERYAIPACLAPEPVAIEHRPSPLVSAEIAQELGFRLEQIAGWQQRSVIGDDRNDTAAATMSDLV